MNSVLHTRLIKEKARELGFDGCGIARADFLDEEQARLRRWLDLGMNGEMKFMNNWFDKRLDPRQLVEGARSVICCLQNYYTDKNSDDLAAPKIAKYARGKDYHWVVKNKLRSLLEFMKENFGSVNGRAFTDSAPILEKAWAARAGLGWIGQNSLLLTRESGSFFFIGELIVDIELEYDQPMADFCAKCRRCIDACPTQAIVKPRVVDARKCISYFTIEYRGELPAEQREKFNNWMFGCDICQDVCPYNRKARPHCEPLFESLPELLGMSMGDWEKITYGTYKKLFRNTAVARTGFKGLKRNITFLSSGRQDEPVVKSDES